VESTAAPYGDNIRGFATDSAGQLWLIDYWGLSRSLGRGAAAVFAFPDSSPSLTHNLSGIVTGPDGAIWVTDEEVVVANGVYTDPDFIDRIDTSGNLTEYPLSTNGMGPQGITVGPDGALWFVGTHSEQIGRITTQGSVTLFSAPSGVDLFPFIVAGADGNLWMSSRTPTGEFLKMNTSGQFIGTYPLPSASGGFNNVSTGATLGPDGNIWAVVGYVNGVASEGGVVSITPSGSIMTYPLPSLAYAVAAGSDGALWVPLYGEIGRITISGQVSTFAIPEYSSYYCQPQYGGPIGAGPNGSLAFSEGGYFGGSLSGGAGMISGAAIVDGPATASFIVPIGGGQSFALDFVVYVVNSSELFLLTSDIPSDATPFLASGRAISAAGNYAAGSLNGSYMFGEEGFDFGNFGNDATIGVAQASANGNVANISFFENDAGNFSTSVGGTGAYTSDSANPSSGRVSIQGLGYLAPVVYLCNPPGNEQIAGFIVGTDPDPSSGELVYQSTAPPDFSSSSAEGLFTFGNEEDLDDLNATFSGVFQPDGSGGYSYVFDVATSVTAGPPFLESGVTGDNSYSINPDGTGTINGNGFYSVTNGQQFFVIPSAVDGLLYVIQKWFTIAGATTCPAEVHCQ